MYDAIFILGGSYINKNTLPSWVESRLNTAIYMEDKTKLFIVLSRGTTHKAPDRDEYGYPIDESSIMANYLIDRDIPKSKIIKETWSFDTIGNAYAALTHHAIPKNLRKILIITSDFHMPRTKAIFDKVFSLSPLEIFSLEYLETESQLSISDKEVASLKSWIERSRSIYTLCDLHDFIFHEHNAYNTDDYNHDKSNYSEKDLQMYCL
jgi:vancomycin permeability regulator SanA